MSGMAAEHALAIVGCGWLGRAVAEAWRGPVLATTRSGDWGEGEAPGHVTMSALDVTAEPLAVPSAPTVMIAYAPGLGGRGGAEAAARRTALYVEGTRRVVSAVAPSTRVIFIGSTSALPERDAWLDESCAEVPESERGRTQREAEAVVLGYPGPSVVLRMGGLFGPGRELDRIYRNREPEAVRPGSGMAPTNLVHRDDAVAAVVAAVERPEVCGVVHVVADGHAPRRAMYAAIAARTGVAAPLWAEAGTGGVHGKRVSNLRLKLELGVRLRHPWPG